MTQMVYGGLAALWLAACAEAPMPVQSDGEPPVVEDTCGAEDYAGLVGTDIAAVTLPADLDARIIRPMEAVTTDHVPERINFDVDADGVITQVRCG